MWICLILFEPQEMNPHLLILTCACFFTLDGSLFHFHASFKYDFISSCVKLSSPYIVVVSNLCWACDFAEV